jgi:membrane protease YdiL (CAAX protease family)
VKYSLGKLNKKVFACIHSLYQKAIRPAIGSPAAWCFAAIWAAAAIYLLAVGHVLWVVKCVGLLVFTLVFCVFTVALTQPKSEPEEKPSRTWRVGLLLQVAVIIFFIVITGYQSLMSHGVIRHASIPLWTPVIRFFGRLGEQLFNSDIVGNSYLALANPARYILLPLPFLLLLGARFRKLGFERGHRTWRVLALWCFVPVVLLISQFAVGRLTLGRIARRLVSNSLQNGFFEEFLFRGALQTRLRFFMSPYWAIVLQAFAFGGLWHIGIGFRETGSQDIIAGVASAIVIRATAGLAFGIIFQRTRNLLACSVIHVVTNSVFIG